MATSSNTPIWKVRHRTRDFEWEGPLVAVWEVYEDPISDDYTPDEISADDLLRKWAAQVNGKYPNDLIPIAWYVDSPGQAKFEGMPFQFEHNPKLRSHNFLSFYDWPVDSKTGEPLNWLALPVVDKRWNKNRANKGGFIQEATGWKPSVLQPYVFLGSLIDSRR